MACSASEDKLLSISSPDGMFTLQALGAWSPLADSCLGVHMQNVAYWSWNSNSGAFPALVSRSDWGQQLHDKQDTSQRLRFTAKACNARCMIMNQLLGDWLSEHGSRRCAVAIMPSSSVHTLQLEHFNQRLQTSPCSDAHSPKQLSCVHQRVVSGDSEHGSNAFDPSGVSRLFHFSPQGQRGS